jgi:hypothetical protein
MTSLKFIPLLLALAACVVAAGCGSDDGKQLPADSVASLERQLDSIQNRFDVGGGACGDISGGADSNTAAVEKTIESLPDDVDADVRDAVQESFDRLFQLVDEQCQEEEEAAPPATEPVEPAPEPTTTVPPATETQETTPPQTEPETQPTTPQQPPQTTPGEGGGETNGGAGGSNGQGGEGNGGGGGDTGSTGGGALVPEDSG